MTQLEDELVAPAIARIAPYEPGKPHRGAGARARRTRGRPGGAIKLASNENPLGPSPLGVAAARRALAAANLYPDGGSFRCAPTLAARHRRRRARRSWSAPARTSSSICWCRPSAAPATRCWRRLLVHLLPAVGARRTGGRSARRRRRRASPTTSTRCLGAVTPRTKIVFFANPNNPDRRLLPGARRSSGSSTQLPARVLLVVDEAYFEYAARRRLSRRAAVPGAARAPGDAAHLLQDLRPGRAARRLRDRARPELIDYVHRMRLPFNVSAIGAGGGAGGARRRRRTWSARARATRSSCRAWRRRCAALGLDGAAVAGQLRARRLRRARRARSSTRRCCARA